MGFLSNRLNFPCFWQTHLLLNRGPQVRSDSLFLRNCPLPNIQLERDSNQENINLQPGTGKLLYDICLGIRDLPYSDPCLRLPAQHWTGNQGPFPAPLWILLGNFLHYANGIR